MVFRWRADDGTTMNAGLVALRFFQGIRTSIAKKPSFLIFRVGSNPPAPSGSSHVSDVSTHVLVCD